MIAKKLLILISILGIFIFFAQSSHCQKYNFTRDKLGSPFSITISAKDTLRLGQVIDRAFRLVDELDYVFSDYKSASEVSTINVKPKGTWIPISNHMFNLLAISQDACSVSKGAFDVTIGQLTKAWRKAKKEGILPTNEDREIELSHCGCNQFDVVKLPNDDNNLMKKNEDFSFDFGGIAKGYIADVVSDYLKRHGYKSHLIDAGGDLVAGEKPRGNKGWKIAIEYPNDGEENLQKMVWVKNESIATSGATYQHITIEGKQYAHILNPKTGLGIQTNNNVTIISPLGSEADWLATACSILNEEEIKMLMKDFKNTTCIISSNRNGQNTLKMFGKRVKFISENK